MNITTEITACGETETHFRLPAGESPKTPITLDIGGTPIDLTGGSIKMQIAFPTPLALNTDNGRITITDAAGGAFQVAFPSMTTLGSYRYDLWVIDSGGHPFRYLFGSFHIEKSVTPVP